MNDFTKEELEDIVDWDDVYIECIVGSSSPFKYSTKFRVPLADKIMAEQSDELKDVK